MNNKIIVLLAILLAHLCEWRRRFPVITMTCHVFPCRYGTTNFHFALISVVIVLPG